MEGYIETMPVRRNSTQVLVISNTSFEDLKRSYPREELDFNRVGKILVIYMFQNCLVAL